MSDKSSAGSIFSNSFILSRIRILNDGDGGFFSEIGCFKTIEFTSPDSSFEGSGSFSKPILKMEVIWFDTNPESMFNFFLKFVSEHAYIKLKSTANERNLPV
jgi:hypothetical protein